MSLNSQNLTSVVQVLSAQTSGLVLEAVSSHRHALAKRRFAAKRRMLRPLPGTSMVLRMDYPYPAERRPQSALLADCLRQTARDRFLQTAERRAACNIPARLWAAMVVGQRGRA